MDNKFSEQVNLVGVGVTVLGLILLSFFIDIDNLKEWVIQAGIWAPFVFIFLKILSIVVAPISGSPLYPLVGVIFGFWPGLLYVAIGDFLGYTLTFGISRIFGRKTVMKFLSKKEESLLPKIVDHIGTTRGFIHALLTMFALPELLSYGAGLSKLPYIKFISILWPASLIASGSLVLLGSSFSLSDKSILISVGIPIIATICVIIGGSLFIKAVKEKGNQKGA